MKMTRKLGKYDIKVSALGLGCWPIGGLWYDNSSNKGKMISLGNIDDKESLRAINRALDLGINFFDTADVYGAGHSEVILGEAFKEKRDKVVLATKFGLTFNEKTKNIAGTNYSKDYIKRACRDSLRRLKTDYIDLYQLHINYLAQEEAGKVFDTLEELKKEGKIREYGWSTDIPESIDFLVNKTKGISVQHQFNVFINADKILDICKKYNIASINRSPLAMGLLSGKFNENSILSKEDFRGKNIQWMEYFKNGKPNIKFLKKINAIHDILTSNGRNLVQGALGWIWAKSEKTIPIPGFRTEKQVEELAKAIEFGPLDREQLSMIDNLIVRDSV